MDVIINSIYHGSGMSARWTSVVHCLSYASWEKYVGQVELNVFIEVASCGSQHVYLMKGWMMSFCSVFIYYTYTPSIKYRKFWPEKYRHSWIFRNILNATRENTPIIHSSLSLMVLLIDMICEAIWYVMQIMNKKDVYLYSLIYTTTLIQTNFSTNNPGFTPEDIYLPMNCKLLFDMQISRVIIMAIDDVNMLVVEYKKKWGHSDNVYRKDSNIRRTKT